MYLLLLIIPFLSFITIILCSRYIGHKGAVITSLSLLLFGLLLSTIIFYEVAVMHNNVYLFLGYWISIGRFEVLWSFSFDFLSITMLTTVYIISFLVHYYSSEYMAGDPHLPRFMAYLSFLLFLWQFLQPQEISFRCF